MRATAAILVCTLLLVSCASSDDDLAEPACITESTDDQVSEYTGLDEDEATALASEQGLVLREVGRDGECLAVTLDFREDRVNVEYADGVVIAAAIY